MKKKLPIIIGLIATFAFAIWMGNTKKAHIIYDDNVNTASYISLGVNTQEQVLEQTFISEEDVVDGVAIKQTVSGDYGSVEVTVDILDDSGKVVATVTEPGSEFRARKVHYFKTDQITGAKGKAFTVRITQANSTASDGIAFYYQVNADAGYKLSIAGNETDGVLVMKSITERFDVERFLVMLFAVWFIWGFMYFLNRLFSK